MNFLETILAHKREEIRLRRKSVSREMLKERPLYNRESLSLSLALRTSKPAVIAEVKKASPSKGIIRNDFDPVNIAGQYIRGGASALSVLTDRRFFQGDLTFLEAIRPISPIPVLRKDFILDSYQLYETKAMGGDAILLIVAALAPSQLIDLRDEAETIGLECLVEVHSEKEIHQLKGAGVRIIGINNRDLATFETTLETTFRLIPSIEPGSIVVSESGITSADDVKRLMKSGVDAVLIGEQLMKGEDPGRVLSELLEGIRS